MSLSLPIMPIRGVVTFFYYDELRPAAEFYERIVGLRKAADLQWCAIFEIVPHSYLGLVNATAGSQRPIPGTNKGAIVSIETDDLDQWLQRMKLAGAAPPGTAIAEGCAGQTREFKVTDPGGYTVEFFTWLQPLRADEQ